MAMHIAENFIQLLREQVGLEISAKVEMPILEAHCDSVKSRAVVFWTIMGHQNDLTLGILL